MKLNKKTVQNYILSCIDTDGYDLQTEPQTDGEKLSFVAENFLHWLCEYELRRAGTYQGAFAYWLMGLPGCINIDFENYKILQIGHEWGSFPENFSQLTEKQREKLEYKILENWFNLIAANTLQMFAKHKINYFINR